MITSTKELLLENNKDLSKIEPSTGAKDTSAYRLAIIDDNPMVRKMVEKIFSPSPDHSLHSYSSGEAFFSEHSSPLDIIILDYHLSTNEEDKIMNGLEILGKIKERIPDAKVIMLSSQGAVSTAVQCLKKGATDYVVKDEVMNVSIKKSVDQIIKSIALKTEITALSQTIKRDKLLMRGYGVIILALLLLVASLYFEVI